MAGTLFVVATPIGNLDDLSPRARRILGEVAVIAAEDTRRTSHLLQRFGLETSITSLHEHNEHAKADDLISRALAGQNVALVSDAGTPTVSDPGEQLIAKAHAAGIRVEPIPGPSAIVAALCASGLPSSSFTFLGFPPTKQSERTDWFSRMRASAAVAPTVVFYESPHRIASTLQELHDEFGDIDVLVARELTKVHEDVRFAPVSSFLPMEGARGEYTVVCNIGQITDVDRSRDPPDERRLADEFGVMTENGGLTRRQAISALSRRHRMTAKELYSALERAKRSIG